jgi:hypothetical protein
MRFDPTDPPRRFPTGIRGEVEISDCGRLQLEPDEQVTLTTPGGGEYDVARKSWGFYATPSLNARLEGFGLRGVLVRNTQQRYFVLLVERGHEDEFEAYRASEQLDLITWMDTQDALDRLADRLA